MLQGIHKNWCLFNGLGVTPGDKSGRQYGHLPAKGSTSNLNFSFFRVFLVGRIVFFHK